MRIVSITTPYIKKPINTSVYSVPLLKGTQRDIVTFGSANVDKEDAFNLRNIPNLPCACCGKKMINEKDFSDLKSKDYQGNAQMVLKKLKPYSKDMRPVEKTVYNLLKRAANKDPHADLNTLINKRYYYHLGRLEVKQLNIINKAIAQDLNLNEKTKAELDKTMETVRFILFVESKKQPQKRSRIIKEFRKLRDKCDEKQKIDKMLEILKTLPTSKDDVDAFMTKYTQRGNREIGQRLMSSALPTLDHITPAKNSGHDSFSNMLVLCEKCNSERGHIPYEEWFEIHPEMPKNIQKNMNKIIMEINEGRLIGFETYPKDVKETLKRVTKEPFILDTSELRR